MLATLAISKCPRRQPRRSVIERLARRHRAFSFAEVMFAVIILGVGFIMIAGIFPVAIQQNQATNEESTAAAAAREAANTISSVASQPGTVTNVATNSSATVLTPLDLFPPTVKNYTCPTGIANVVPPPAIVAPFTGARWQAIVNSVISTSDNRYAYVPFYKREYGQSVAQLIVIATSIRNRSVYSANQDTTYPLSMLSSPSGLAVTRGSFATNASNAQVTPDWINMAAASAYPGYSITMDPNNGGVWSGRTYRLGRNVANSALYELDPPDTLTETMSTTTGSNVANSAGVADQAGTLPNGGAPAANVVWPQSTLQPVVAYAHIFSSPGSLAGRIELITDYADYPGTPNNYKVPSVAVPGAFVIVADDYPYDSNTPGNTNYLLPANAPTANPPWMVGALNGRIFRLGAAVPINTGGTPAVYAGTFELDPAYGMRAGVGAAASPDTVPNPDISMISGEVGQPQPLVRVYIVGAGRTNPATANDGPVAPADYSGAAQDISVYTTFIPVAP